MKRRITSFLPVVLATLFLIPLLSFTAVKNPAHAASKWQLLGQRTVNFRVVKDEIRVGKFDGYFDALQVKVKRGPVNMLKMSVHFHNGETKEIELRNNFTAGSESRVIDLPGNKRAIDRVDFWYETKGFARSRAIVELWGRH